MQRRFTSAKLDVAVVASALAAILLLTALLNRPLEGISSSTPRITSIRIVPDPDEIRLHRSKQVFNALAMTPLDSFEQARAAIGNAKLGKGSADVDDAQKEQLLDAAAKFLTLYAGQSATAYIDWRKEHGFALTPPTKMREDRMLDTGYEFWVGKPLPDDMKQEEVFEAIWKAVRTKDGGQSRLVVVASDSNGLAVAFNNSDDEDDGYPTVEGGIPQGIWYGNSSGSARLWWSRDRNVRALRADHKKVLDACVAVVVQFKSGGRHPLHMRFFWDELSKQWELEFVSLSLIYADSNRFDLGYAIIEF